MGLHYPDKVRVGTLLSVQLLGPPNTTWANQSLSLPRRQVRALLYRLAAERAPVARSRLCFLFWPDTPESDARRKLSGLLNHLHRSLPAPDLLVSEDDRVYLDPARTWSDTVAFDQLCRHDGDLRQAADLYRGPFLDTFSLPDSPEYEMWAALERQTWERRYLDILATLIGDYTTRKDYDAAITFARRYLEIDELAEEIHRRLIELYVAVGDRASARRQFEQCASVLERELGVRPLPETQAVFLAVVETRPLPRALLDTEPKWTTLPSLDVGLIGRHSALQHLDEAFHRASQGAGGVVLISGEPGIGKSRLVQEFSSRVDGEALILVGAGFRDMHSTPYQPIVDALRPALRDGYQWFAPPRCCLAEATRVLPELPSLYPGVTPPSIGNDVRARARLFEALSNITLALAAGPHPLVLCLDDLQWADSTTLEWLSYLGRRTEGARLLVLGTFRSDAADTVAELRHALNRQGILTELELDGLDKAAVLQVIRDLHGARPVKGAQAAAARLVQVTGGNPFFLLETLRELVESGRPMESMSGVEDLPLSDTIMEVVEARVRRLGPRARQVLEAGAVLGQVFTLELIHRTSGRRELETIDGLDELVARHLLTEYGSEYRFRHELIRVAVSRGLSYWRQRVLHRRAGETLERLQPENVAALARHYAQAEEFGRAAGYALQAGRAAKTVFAHIEAKSHFDRALALLKQEAARLHDPGALAANQALQVEALHERGWALRLLGDMAAYTNDLKEVACLAESLHDQRALAHLRWREAYTHRWFCRYPQSRQAAEEGLALSREQGDTLLEAHCWREIGMVARETGDYGGAQAALERSLVLYSELGETVFRIHVLGNLATLQWYLADYQRSMNLAQQALDICNQEGLPLERRLPLGDLGAAAAALGDAELARRCLEESLSIAQETADRTQEIYCLLHLGWLYVRQKEPANALHYLGAGLKLAEKLGSCAEQGRLLGGLSEAYRLAETDERAQAHAQRALAFARGTGRPYDESLACGILDQLRRC